MKVTNILSAIDAAEYLITHNASHVVKQVQKILRNTPLAVHNICPSVNNLSKTHFHKFKLVSFHILF